ncbi:MAG: hypothetical protein Q8Q60_05350 [Candidatus Chromulinivorax sp.]|nr:hypothetical protein [Candidatus Chromulinivorax sp.]
MISQAKKNITLAITVAIVAIIILIFIDPILQMLPSMQLKQLDSLIFYFTTTKFFLYIHTIIMILLALWTTIGIYYVYKFYNK